MRLIDADAMKELWQGCEIKGSISPLLDVRPTVDAIIIPENATNGDMIKALFPNVEVKEKNNGYEVYFGVGTAIQLFNNQWWNAPYDRSE